MTRSAQNGYDWSDALPTLPGERITLRWLTQQDIPAIYAIFNHPDVTRYWSFAAFQSIQQAAELLTQIHDHFEERSLFQWGIEENASGRIIGTTTLFKLDQRHRRAEIGYALNRSRWRHGLASDAVSTLLRFAFDQLNLHRIEADADPRNSASIQLLERQGFVREGLMRERYHVHGEIQDSAILGLIQRDWVGRKPPPRDAP